VNTLCLEGCIEGAIKFGNTWVIPEDAEKPKYDRKSISRKSLHEQTVEEDI